MRTSLAIAVAVMLAVAGCAQAPGAGTTEPTTDATTEDEQRDIVKPDDPESDVPGWEDGYWYNETIDVTPEDGLNETELEKVVSRAMARVEQIRGLEFEERVPVEIQTREEFSAEQANRSLPPDRQLFDNVKFESLFMINESTDSLAVQNRNSGAAIGGFYSPSEERIVVISENAETPQLDEITLSQELFHALQDQKFDLSSFNQSTREQHNAVNGIVEGDGNYVDYLYEQHCRDEWDGDCLMPEGQPGSDQQLANIGPYLLKFQPYSDGPPFVRDIHERDGWEAVNALYDDPPRSTEQVIHPEKYGEDEPAEFRVEDTSGESWERLNVRERPNFGSVGEAGVFAMFMYPYYKSQGQTPIIPGRDFFNMDESGELREFDPLNYESSYSDGWDGDKLAVYTSETTPRNETAYVWKTVWDSEEEAAEFVEGYEKLLEYNDATPVDGREDTWRIPEDSEFDDAFHVRQEGDTVVIVNAPTVDDLPEVRQGAAPEQ